MNIENKIAVARIAADITIAALNGKDGHLKSLMDGKLPTTASPIEVFDHVNNHLQAVMTDD